MRHEADVCGRMYVVCTNGCDPRAAVHFEHRIRVSSDLRCIHRPSRYTGRAECDSEQEGDTIRPCSSDHGPSDRESTRGSTLVSRAGRHHRARSDGTRRPNGSRSHTRTRTRTRTPTRRTASHLRTRYGTAWQREGAGQRAWLLVQVHLVLVQEMPDSQIGCPTHALSASDNLLLDLRV